MSAPLKVQDVIQKAIDENRARESLLVGFAVVFVALGAIILGAGLIRDSVIAYGGVAESLLFVPTVALVRRINHENTALRLLEIPLRKAKTADEAARVLTRFFASAYRIAHRSED